MRILFDQGTPAPLRNHLPGHQVDTVHEKGWSQLENGKLLETTEGEGYDLFLTTDQNLRYQQNFANRSLAIVVLKSTSWPLIQQSLSQIAAIVDHASPGDFHEIAVP